MAIMVLSMKRICCKICNGTRKYSQLNTLGPIARRVQPVSRLSPVVYGYGEHRYYFNSNSLKLGRKLWPYPRRYFYTSIIKFGVNVRPLTITSRLAADRLIRDMTDVERERLTQALNHLQEEFELEKIVHMANKPTVRQLSLVFVSNSLPFVGFGLLDNAIMIAAGEYIDCTVGCALGISTMAAAAIGNMISDVAGIGLAGYVESMAGRLGLEEPHLTAHQLTMKSTRIACHSGRAVGIVIGCIIGMFPLLFINNNATNVDDGVKADHTEASNT